MTEMPPKVPAGGSLPAAAVKKSVLDFKGMRFSQAEELAKKENKWILQRCLEGPHKPVEDKNQLVIQNCNHNPPGMLAETGAILGVILERDRPVGAFTSAAVGTEKPVPDFSDMSFADAEDLALDENEWKLKRHVDGSHNDVVDKKQKVLKNCSHNPPGTMVEAGAIVGVNLDRPVKGLGRFTRGLIVGLIVGIALGLLLERLFGPR